MKMKLYYRLLPSATATVWDNAVLCAVCECAIMANGKITVQDNRRICFLLYCSEDRIYSPDIEGSDEIGTGSEAHECFYNRQSGLQINRSFRVSGTIFVISEYGFAVPEILRFIQIYL